MEQYIITLWHDTTVQAVEPSHSRLALRADGALASALWLGLQHVPEGTTVKKRVYLDCTVADVDPAVNCLLALGGGKVREVCEEEGHDATMTDPDGNALCVAASARSHTGERMPALAPPCGS